MGKRTNTATWLENYNRWQIKVQKDGERRTFTCSVPGRKGQRECNGKADAWLDDGIVEGETRLSVLYTKWIAEIKETKGTSHWKQCDYFGRVYITPCKGKKRISEVNNQDLQDIINKAFKTGNSGKGLSHKTLKDLRTCLSAFIKYARKSSATKLYPEDLYIPKGAAKSNRDALQPHDIEILFSSDKTLYRTRIVDDWYIHAYRFETICGLRPGELVALKDANISAGYCVVQSAYNNHNEFTEGKNSNAVRRFKLPQTGLDILKQQKSMLKKAGVISPYVFPAKDGEITSQRIYRNSWKRYRDHNKITPDRVPYEFRHTFFSANKDVPGELLKPVGGHGKDFDTFGTYGHKLEGEAEIAAQLIDENFKKYIKK